MVDQTSGRRDDDVRLLGQRQGLRYHVHAAHYYCTFHTYTCTWNYQETSPLTDIKSIETFTIKSIVKTPSSKVLPKASNCSDIWNANSLVGVSTNAKYLWGFSNKACSIGRANAPVLPEPVSARPMMSLPCNATGIASRWIFDGFFHFKSAHASHKTSTTPWKWWIRVCIFCKF